MPIGDSRFVIGIDLGTTNCAVAYADLQQNVGERRIELFAVPQLTAAGAFERVPVLPSFLYLPGAYDIDAEAIAHPWSAPEEHFVGLFARDHGAKVPARLVSSAKSWLCHNRVDRRGAILPWGAPAEVRKLSPVAASAAYLQHIRRAWNHARGENEELFLENQAVVITVPASFDEVARDLTLEASRLAGIPAAILLEEPVAAFYSWLQRHEGDWAAQVGIGELILVCDVGGGTTDFTLIALQAPTQGTPRFERIAVGDHLILGGDNIDLALARLAESRFGQGHGALSGDRWKTLCHACRLAKEQLLAGSASSRTITLVGEGRRLIAGTLSATLGREQIEQVVLDGFFPLVAAGSSAPQRQRQGISELGLPYESEPAITRHLALFLERQGRALGLSLGPGGAKPNAVLFNGGALKPALIRERIRSAIGLLCSGDAAALPRELDNPDPDLAVALGAAYYGLVKAGIGVRVGSGSPRAYYLEVDRKPEASQGEPLRQALCLVERGLDEGSAIALPQHPLEVLANRPVAFTLYSSSYRSGDRCGALVALDDSLTPLPPLQTVVEYGKRGQEACLPVRIEGQYSEVGTLALWCRSLSSHHRWRLQFQLRQGEPAAGVGERAIIAADLVEDAADALQHAFAAGGQLAPLVRELERGVQLSREQWPLGLIRTFADRLLALAPRRGVSPEHEARWLNLLGFCLRPGFGDGADPQRMKRVWQIYREGLHFTGKSQVRAEWWIFWRRIGGGLSAGQQRQVSQDLASLLSPARAARKQAPQEALEIWMAVANLERLPVADKIRWGRQLLTQLTPGKIRPQYLWTLGRIGAREPLYGPVDRAIAPAEAGRWVESLMAGTWRQSNAVTATLVQLSRRSGDRLRDLDAALLQRVIHWLERAGTQAELLRPLREVVPLEIADAGAIFGESLPNGLILIA